jgi:hypothetical protein
MVFPYRYPSYDDAKRAAHRVLELMKHLERSRMKLSILAEIGLLKFPQGFPFYGVAESKSGRIFLL